MWVLEAIAVGVTLGAGVAAVAGIYVVRTARRLPPFRRGAPRIVVRPPAPAARDEGADLLAYPQRLAELEDRLVDRHRAVQQQLHVLSARRAEVAAKGGRDDLARKYDADLAMLLRRGESMRRVMGLVWKTRGMLLLRVHLAVTARRRPALGRLPQPGTPGVQLAAGAAAYHEAATAVRFYLDEVEARAAELPAVVPAAPPSAEVDDAMRAAVDREMDGIRAAYADLRDRMDRLADNLTFLGDHFGALAVVDDEPDDARALGGSGHLLEEVGAAIAGLNELAGRVDPGVVDSAFSNLAEEITHLEEAGLEAEAEAEAHLEVERLLAQFQNP